MLIFGQKRYVDLFVANAGVPVTGLTLSSLVVFFTRNGVACVDSLSLLESSQGHYSLVCTPTAPGHDYLYVTYSPASYAEAFVEEIVLSQTVLGGGSAVQLTQDTPSTGALKVTLPFPSEYTLYVFNTTDWLTGNTETFSAVASTQIDGSGNWLTPVLNIVSGLYNVVLRDGSGRVQVIKYSLQV